MKIHYTSDLHLEFGTPLNALENFKGGDVLILAGDITNSKHKGLDILDPLCKRYNDVVMVMGNHEHYEGKFPLTYTKLREVLPSNVKLLENEILTIDGQRFIGCSLWSYMNEVDQYLAKYRMNDYIRVRNGPPSEPWKHKLSPTVTVSTHMNSARWLDENMQEGDIVVTHHAPSFASCNSKYTGNTAYATDLSDMILEHKPKYWIHGHLHDVVSYNIGDTAVKSNPLGYWRHQAFKPLKLLEIIC